MRAGRLEPRIPSPQPATNPQPGSPAEKSSVSFVRRSLAEPDIVAPVVPDLPAFNTVFPREWFAFTEQFFDAHGVKDHESRFRMLKKSLSPIVLVHVGNLAIFPWQPEHGDVYSILKTRLLQKFGKSTADENRPTFSASRRNRDSSTDVVVHRRGR